MDTGSKKRWAAVGVASFFAMILFLSTVDLSERINPTGGGKGLESRLSASEIERVPERSETVSHEPRNFPPYLQKLDPSQAEGYKEPAEEIHLEDSEEVSPAHPYSVLIGSFRNRRNAEIAMEACRKKGYPVYEARVDLKKRGTWTRVFAGCFVNLEGAQEFIRKERLGNAAPMKTRYANLIGTFRSIEALQKQIRNLNAQGHSPYFIQGDDGRCRLYAGAFETLDEAEMQAAALTSAGVSCQPVKR